MFRDLKECYKSVAERTADKILKYKDCFRIAVVTDTHLDNSAEDTVTNLAAVNSAVKYNCIIHLGDFLNGNLPRTYTKIILKNQMDMFRTAAKQFLPVQGNHDGFADMITPGMCNVALDEDWYEATSFADAYEGMTRESNKPYFYIDYTKYKIRVIILCTFYYNGSYENGSYEKVYGTDDEQCRWFEEKALKAEAGWTVIICSHDAPFECFDEKACDDNPRINGNRLMEAVKMAETQYGIIAAVWFVGHFHGDFAGKVNGLKFVLVASETAYVPQLWDMPEGGCYPERGIETASEDLWDSVVIAQEERKIRIFRFGAGLDREIDY